MDIEGGIIYRWRYSIINLKLCIMKSWILNVFFSLLITGAVVFALWYNDSPWWGYIIGAAVLLSFGWLFFFSLRNRKSK